MGRQPGLHAAAAVLLATVWLWPHILHLRQVPDRGDPVFSSWRIARLAHQIAHDPRHLFDGNIFYPRHWTLAYSDATFLEGLAGAPFVLAGADPLIVANVLFLIAFPLCGLAFFYAGWRLTGDPAAGLVAGVLGAWYPFHGEHYSHLELQWFMFVPLAFAAMLEVIADPAPRKGAALAAYVALQSLASMYLGLMLACALVPAAVVRLALTQHIKWRALVRGAAVAAAVLLPFAAALAIPYERARLDHGDRAIDEVQSGSAAPGDYLKTSRRLAAYSWHERAMNKPERELFPGTSTLVLAAAGAVTAPAVVSLPLLAAGAAAFDWSLGLNGASYRALTALVPLFGSVRVPARFAAIVGSVLVLLAAAGAHAIISRAGARRAGSVAALLVTAILIDLRLTVSLVDYYPGIPSVYARLGPESVVAAFPAGHDVDTMYASTTSWPNLLGGDSGFIPQDTALFSAEAEFPDPASIDALRAGGATHLVYVCAFERSMQRCDTNSAVLASNRRLELIATERWLDAPVRLYRIGR